MNRRDFIKAAVPSAALATWTVTCKYEEPKEPTPTETTPQPECGYRWDYRVYCYERGQGEWVFKENTRGSFAFQREYMTPEDDQGWPYAGWMDGGKLHFVTLEEAQDFVDMHVRAKDDINLIDSIYDIYYVDRYCERVGDEDAYRETEHKVAHYWFNGDTGRQIHWAVDQRKKDWKTNWTAMDCA